MHIYHDTVGKHIVCNQTYYKWRLSQCFAFNHYFQKITGLTVYIACRFQTLLGQHRKKGRDGPIWLMLKLDIKEGKKPIGLDLHRELYAGLYAIQMSVQIFNGTPVHTSLTHLLLKRVFHTLHLAICWCLFWPLSGSFHIKSTPKILDPHRFGESLVLT